MLFRSFDGEPQVEVLRTIRLLIRLDDVVRVRARNGLGNRGKGFLITDELYASTQEGARNLYPKSIQQTPVDQQSLRGITRRRVINLYRCRVNRLSRGNGRLRRPWNPPQRAQPFPDQHLGADKHDRGHLRVP